MQKQHQLLGINSVIQRTGMGRSTIYRDLRRRTFPQPIKVGSQNRWLASDIDDWISQQVKQAQQAQQAS